MDKHDIIAVGQIVRLEHRTERIVLIRLVDDIEVARVLSDDVIDELLVHHIARRIIGIAKPVEAVFWQNLEFIVSIIRQQVIIDLTGILVFRKGRLRDDGCPSAIELCDEVDSLRSTIGDHNGLLWHAELLSQHPLQSDGLRLRIMAHDAEAACQVCLQPRQVSAEIDVGTEVHLDLCPITIGVVTVSEYHRF